MKDWYWRSYSDFSSSSKVKIRISNFLKNQVFGFKWCSTREDLSIDVSITNEGLTLTKLWWFQIFSSSSKVKIQISNFFEKTKIGFPWCNTNENLSIDVSIANVGLILTKLRWFQLLSKIKFRILNLKKKIKFLDFHCVVHMKTFPLMYQLLMYDSLTKLRWFQLFIKSRNLNFELFWKKKSNFWVYNFPWCSTHEDLSIDVSITNVGLILTKLWWFLFSGCGQTDTDLESSYGNMSAHKKFQLKAQN